MSIKAQSRPARAFAATPHLLCRVLIAISVKRISKARGSFPINEGFRSLITPSIPWGDFPSEHSPQPTNPSSVSTLTNIQGRQPASTIKVCISEIFIFNIPLGVRVVVNWMNDIEAQSFLTNVVLRPLSLSKISPSRGPFSTAVIACSM